MIGRVTINWRGGRQLRMVEVTPDELMKVWRIDREAEERTLNCTTQLKKQDAAAGISRRFSTNN